MMRYIDFTQTREGIEMTPCEKLGYKVGDKFEVIANTSSHSFNLGDIVSLLTDDRSNMPRMKLGLKELWVYLKDLKKITDSEGWIEWKGGECPVEKGTLVDIKLRDGDVFISILVDVVGWSHKSSDSDSDSDEVRGREIISYRLSEPKKVDSDDFVPFGDNGRVGSSIETKDYSLDIITLISSVAPNVSVSDALEIASTLHEHGFKK